MAILRDTDRKRGKGWSAVLILLGIVPFAAALVLGLPIFRASYLTYGDFLILYSYLFWPTYILGAALTTAGVIWRSVQKHRSRKETGQTSES